MSMFFIAAASAFGGGVVAGFSYQREVDTNPEIRESTKDKPWEKTAAAVAMIVAMILFTGLVILALCCDPFLLALSPLLGAAPLVLPAGQELFFTMLASGLGGVLGMGLGEVYSSFDAYCKAKMNQTK